MDDQLKAAIGRILEDAMEGADVEAITDTYAKVTEAIVGGVKRGFDAAGVDCDHHHRAFASMVQSFADAMCHQSLTGMANEEE